MRTPTNLAQRLRAARMAMHPQPTQRAVAKLMKMSPSAVNLSEITVRRVFN